VIAFEVGLGRVEAWAASPRFDAEGVMPVAMAREHEDLHGDQAREPDDHQP
jgi:hypothetical protein